MSALIVLTSCASVTHDSTQGIKIETKTPDGEFITGAQCEMSNDYGIFKVESGGTVQVRRSGKDLEVTCKTDGQPDATAKAVSRTNSGMWGNILIGGGIGAIVDHNTGKAYNYPEWIQLVYGEHLYFDRANHEEGAPTLSGPRKKESLADASEEEYLD